MRVPSRAALAAVTVVATSAAASVASAAPQVVTIAGGGATNSLPPVGMSADARSVKFLPGYLYGITALSDGSVLFADQNRGRVVSIADGQVRIVAGSGSGTFSGPFDDTTPLVATATPVGFLRGLAAAGAATAPGVAPYLIAENEGSSVGYIRRVDTASPPNMFTPVGNGTSTAAADGSGGNATGASSPGAVVAIPSTAGAFFYADAGNHRVRRFSGGTVTTVAGSGGNTGTNPPADNVGATTRELFPSALSTNRDGSVFWVASIGDGLWQVSGGNFHAVPGAASASGPQSIVALDDGSILVLSFNLGTITRLSAAGVASNIAGTGAPGPAGPDGPADQTAIEDGKMSLGPDGLVFTQNSSGIVRLLPATAIEDGPSGTVSSTSADFALSSWDAGATFECRRDAGSFSAANCEPQAGLEDGPHTFEARATTAAPDTTAGTDTFTDPTPVVRAWTVDTTPPELTLGAPADGATVTGSKPEFTWSGGADAVSFELAIDGVPAMPVCSAQTCSFTPSAPLGDGPHSWRVRALDAVGNPRTVERSLTVAAPPAALLSIAPTRALVGRSVTFSGAASADENGSIARYEWDLGGDGAYETDGGSEPTLVRSFDHPQTLTVGLRVTDGAGLTSTTTGQLVVTQLAPTGKPLGVSINDGAQYTNDPNVTIFAVWPSFASTMLLSNDGGFGKAVSFGVAEQTPWRLDSSGPERLPKTVYIRYTGGSQTSETFTDDIILDETPPKVTAATLSGGPAAARAAASATVTLKIAAKDNVSGVGRMQVTTSKRKPGKLRAFKRAIKVKPAKAYYVRVRDRAGNLSRWRAARRR
jgi:hypothetical protein